VKISLKLLLVFIILHAGAASAEDIDVFRAAVKNNAMMVFDTSGSMSMPVYDQSVDYAVFMMKMIDDNVAVDENDCRDGSTWWDRNSSGDDYDRLVPDRIYLVSTWSEITDVSWIDSSGAVRQTSVINDVLRNVGNETDPSLNKRHPLLTNAIIPVKDSAGNHWTVSDPTSFSSDSDGHVIFPDVDLIDTEGHEVIVSSSLRRLRLPGSRDILVAEIEQDPLTGEYLQMGLSGILGSSGFYFSGLYEKEGATLEITDNSNNAETGHGGKQIYLFATGNWLNFIKMVEDFRIASSYYSCTNEGTYSHQRFKAWQYVCSHAGSSPVSPCCSEVVSYDWKIQSRLDVAKKSAKRILLDTENIVNWGLTVFNGSNGGIVSASPGTGVDSITDILEGLRAGGACPIGEAIQDAYKANFTYLNTNHETSECAYHYIVVFSAGLPSEDNDWQRIDNDARSLNYPSPEFGICQDGYGSNCGYYGDADVWPTNNYSDDLAHWLYHEAGYKHSVLTVGFDIPSPMLEDMADSSSGIHITAGSEQRLVNVLSNTGFGISAGSSYTAPTPLVSPANRTRNGDFVYATFFKPDHDSYWKGNLKKYGLSSMDDGREDCGRSEPESLVVDRYGNTAVSCDGTFDPASVSLWSSTSDGGDVTTGGAGGLLKESIDRIDVEYGPYYDVRNIYTCKNASVSRELVRFWRDGDSSVSDTIQPSDLGLTGNTKAALLKRDMIINHVYGYTFSAVDSGDSVYNEEMDGAPLAKRDWILGDIIHSEPCVIDYLNQNHDPAFRFIAVGANDGMLHVFADNVDPDHPDASITIGNRIYRPGDEIWAFIPGDLLTQLKNFETPEHHQYFVDGSCSLHSSRTWRNAGSGSAIRRNGEYYDKVLVFGERRGGRSYWALDVSKPDPLEWSVKWHLEGGVSQDNFSEHLGFTWSKPVLTAIMTGAQSITEVVIFGGGYDPEEDLFPEPWVDGNNDGIYSAGNSDDVFDVNDMRYDAYDNDRHDVFNPEKNETGSGIFIVKLSDGSLVFKATYGLHDNPVGNIQTFAEMKYCFPADPSVIELQSSLVIYLADIYGNIWKVDYNDSRSEKWEVKKVFMSNPGSNQSGAIAAISDRQPSFDISDQGRKMFYSPDISWQGNNWTSWPVLYFGTGDRSHPNYIPEYHNRFYAVSDIDVTADETDLLNLTCDELDANADANQNSILEMGGFLSDADLVAQESLYAILHGSDNYPESTSICRGWYRVLGLQGECTQGQTMDHAGEMCLSRPVLFNRAVYFTTFQPDLTSPCETNGNAFIYALDYSYGTGAYDMNSENSASALADSGTLEDTYQLVESRTIPSGIRVISSPGSFSAFVSTGGKFAGAGMETSSGNGHSTSIPAPPGGLIRLLWDTN